MKKSLSVVLSATVALSMFSSVAFGKTSADFTDLKDLDAATKAKFDAMISAGIFDGVTDTTFGLKDEMNRAQFAKVAALIMGLDVNKDLKTSSFTDVSVDDAANGYALPYIEALKTAGVTDGVTDTTFDPAGKVTKEQLATFLDRVLGKDADAKAKTGTDATVSGWAQGYVALALELKLLPNGADGTFGGQANATRDLLLTGAYEAKQQYVPAGKVSVTDAKAAGVQTVTVNFNKPVDTDKAKLALTKGTVAVATTAKFADDKKSATLTLTDTKLMAGDYTVTMSGLDAAAVDKTTATFTAQDEQVQKIEFVTASDTIAKATNTQVKLKATNQYGELASASAGNYNFYGDVVKLTKNTDGYLIATINSNNATAGVGIVTATITNNDSHVTATKNFTVGTTPILSKVELGTPVYSNGTAINGTGDNAKFALNFFDQYGSLISYDTITANAWNPTLVWNDYTDAATYAMEDDGNGNPVLKISLTKNVDKSGDFTFTFIDQAASSTGKVSIKSAKLATKVQIGNVDDVIAAGDNDAYVPLIAYDAAGNQLSADDIVSTENQNQIRISSSTGTGNFSLETVGSHKGQIHLTNIPAQKNGSISVSAFIATSNVSSSDTKNFTVQAARIPDHIKEVTAPGKQLLPGGSTAFQYTVIDQYGKQLDTLNSVDSNGNVVTSGGNSYSVTVTARTYTPQYTGTPAVFTGYASAPDSNVAVGTSLNGTTPMLITADNDAVVNSTGSQAVFASSATPTTITDVKAFNGNTYRFAAANVANAKNYKTDLVVTILKNGTDEMNKLTRTVTVADSASTDITYSVNSVATLWNAKDSGIVDNAAYGASPVYNGDNDGTNVLGKNTQLSANSMLGREVTISAKNAAGEVVGLPKRILSISSSDTNVA
ncbi:S-layer homology domain-containing protein, partial [Paenibacillus sp. GCM10027628]|uniref:S-layer homology domain-containing protein n=1 Tax=Paenibacillus sp. GCM10027628 TaxID=3273413 RepID=UPI00362B1F09